jgi:hypothetical protein
VETVCSGLSNCRQVMRITAKPSAVISASRAAVRLEGRAAAMGAIAIELDDQSLLRPEEVDDERADPHIHLGLWKAVAATERQEARFELAAGAIRLELRIEGQAQEFGSSQGCRELGLGKHRAEVPQGSGRCGHRDAQAARDLAGAERSGAVNSDATAATLRLARHSHMGDPSIRLAPPRIRAQMTTVAQDLP